MTRLSRLLALLTAIVCAAPAEAGPWARDFGSAYLKLGFNSFSSEQSFRQGVAMDLGFESIRTNLYAEIGLPMRMTLVADVPYVIATNIAPSGTRYTNNTFGDGRFELDFQFVDGLPVSLGIETKIPLYQTLGEQGDDGLIEVDGTLWPLANFPVVGDDNIDVTVKILSGFSFYPVPAWATVELGYRARLGDFVDGIYWAAGAGGFVWTDHIAVGVYANGISNVAEDTDTEVMATPEFVYLQGYLLITAAPIEPDLGFTVAYGGVVHAANSSSGNDVSLGLSYDW
jgi:hypothetical protein